MRDIKSGDLAMRGFVTTGGDVVAWPTLLADHNDFHRTFHTTDDNFALRWRQWSPGERPSFDRVVQCFTQDEAEQIVVDWLAGK